MRAPEFWWRQGALPWFAPALMPLEALWIAAGRARRARVTPVRAGVPVVCIGNLTAGGAGKTPVALAVAERLIALGRTPFFLSRGYGGRLKGPVRADPARHSAADIGDEPLLLAQTAPVVVGGDRVAGAALAVAQGADALVMDDGFQNPHLAKDLSLVVVDAHARFGNRRVTPLGPLREPIGDGLRRAQALVVMGEGETPVKANLPVLRAALSPAATIPPVRALAFAGIGRPEKFFATLAGAGVTVMATRAFPDHYAYRAQDVEALRLAAAADGLTLVTTAKDLVRLPPPLRAGILSLPVRAVFADPAALDALLRQALAHGTSRSA